jgi:hypothetical protein
MAAGDDTGEGTGKNTGPQPITSPFDWGLGSASVPDATPGRPASVPDSPAPAAPIRPVPDTAAPAAPIRPDSPVLSPAEPVIELIPAEPVSAASASSRPAEPYFSSDSDDDVDPTTPIDSLFGETQFKDYEGEPLIGAIPGRLNPFAASPFAASPSIASPFAASPSAASPSAAGPFAGFGSSASAEGPLAEGVALPSRSASRESRAPFSRNQKLLFWISGAVIALLVLALLFVIGTKIAPAPEPVAATRSAAPKASPSTSPGAIAATGGAAAVGVHLWSDLRGGECVDPYSTPFDLRFTVVDCAAPHPAQMVFRGTFPGEATVAYPGLDSLQSQINLLCTAPGVIDLATAGAYSDIQFQASYAATAAEWTKGQHDYFCFVNRSGGEPITGSVAGTPAK